ncbi:MAG TPA: DUF4926 domain-containing protein [Bacteroidota bacterium]|nr:DUF4926 domain-containing protein [Bacteroidota bacterium]
MKVLDLVVLQKNLPTHRLKKGDVGTVVHVHPNNGCEVEFVTLDGKTLAVVSLKSSEIRKAGKRQIPHVRAVA